MSTDLNELDPDSPEYEAAIEEAQRKEDEAREGGTTPQGERPAETTSTTDEPAAETPPAETPPANAAPEPKVAGVASKDGKRVLPYAALQGARQETKREQQARIAAENRAAELAQQLADLKAGKKSDAEVADDQLEEVITDFPQMAPVVKELKELRKSVAAAPAPAASTPNTEADLNDLIAEAIDTVPLLAEWKAKDPEKWSRAIAHDDVLRTSPKWKGKTFEERFAEATRLTAAEFDIPFEDESTVASQQPNRRDPKEVVQAAARAAPNTLSDFKGGAAPRNESIDKQPASKQVAAFDRMSDAEIDAHLAKFG